LTFFIAKPFGRFLDLPQVPPYKKTNGFHARGVCFIIKAVDQPNSSLQGRGIFPKEILGSQFSYPQNPASLSPKENSTATLCSNEDPIPYLSTNYYILFIINYAP
jgi:hypothetical protein